MRLCCLAAVGGLLGAGLWLGDGLQAKDSPASPSSSREADRAAITQSARDFTTAFEKGDAKAVAALWTEQGEYESDDGTILLGRAAIEAAFAAHFKARPGEKMEIKVQSIRFPSRNTALEEGLTVTSPADGLPDSARYRVLHVREDGKWHIALCREWAAGENHLADLDWLIGTSRGPAKGHDMVITFRREKNFPFLVGEFTATAADKTESLGTMKIGVDPASGKFMSWHFDPDGGYGHGFWLSEGKHWAIDAHGIRGDGAQTAAVNVLTRSAPTNLNGARSIGWLADSRSPTRRRFA